MSDTTDTARRVRAIEYEGMTFHELCYLVVKQVDEIAALREAVRDIHNLAAAPTRPERVNEDWPTTLCKRLGEIRMTSRRALEEEP